MSNTRQATCRILELIEDGILDRDMVINSCLKYMSESDVQDMAHCNDFGLDDDDDDEEDEEDEEWE